MQGEGVVELFFMEVFFMETAVDSAGDRERWAKTPVRVPAVMASKTPAADPAHSSATCSDMLLLPPK